MQWNSFLEEAECQERACLHFAQTLHALLLCFELESKDFVSSCPLKVCITVPECHLQALTDIFFITAQMVCEHSRVPLLTADGSFEHHLPIAHTSSFGQKTASGPEPKMD